MSRMLRLVLVIFRAFPTPTGSSTRHERDMEHEFCRRVRRAQTYPRLRLPCLAPLSSLPDSWTMSRATKAATIALSIAFAGITVVDAMAGNWGQNHPRREQVNDRLQNQNRRINREVREGEITKGQARQLHSEDRAIRSEERTMSKLNNGHITPAEQKSLNQQENAVSRQIGR